MMTMSSPRAQAPSGGSPQAARYRKAALADAMRAIAFKELREQAPLATLGGIVYGIILFGVLIWYAHDLRNSSRFNWHRQTALPEMFAAATLIAPLIMDGRHTDPGTAGTGDDVVLARPAIDGAMRQVRKNAASRRGDMWPVQGSGTVARAGRNRDL